MTPCRGEDARGLGFGFLEDMYIITPVVPMEGERGRDGKI